MTGRSSSLYATPRWVLTAPDDVLVGGHWALMIFDDDADDTVGDGPGHADLAARYEVLIRGRLVDLMIRADWAVWLMLHIRAAREVDAAAAELLDRIDEVAGTERRRTLSACGRSVPTLLALQYELAAATLKRGEKPDCPYAYLAEMFATLAVYLHLLPDRHAGVQR